MGRLGDRKYNSILCLEVFFASMSCCIGGEKAGVNSASRKRLI